MTEDLSAQERELIADLIREGKPIPPRYIPSITDNPTRTELIWPGKSNNNQSIVLPFQSIEHIDEPRKESNAQFDLFSVSQATGRQSGGWTNKLIWGDNSLILSSLLNGPMRNQIENVGGLKLVYIDPPFDVGADFSMDIEVGEETVKKEPSVVEEVAFRDTWGRGKDSFLSMIYPRIVMLHSLFAADGVIAVHIDWRLSAQVRIILDEIFGQDNFINEIIWHYDQGARGKNRFGRKHDTIFVYAKSEDFTFNSDSILEPYESGMTEWRYTKGGQAGKEMPKGKIPSDVWDMKLNAMSKEHNGYPTQKPESLLNRFIEAFSSPGDLVADFFCGSGTTLAVAEKLGRKWIGSDLSRFAIHTTRKRLIAVQREALNEGKPFRAFEILNLGGYERAHQAGIDFSLDESSREAQAAVKRQEFIDLILSAYEAQKSDQLPPFVGVKGSTAIFIGGVDSAVTQDHVQQAIDTALAVGVSRVDVLGFEFEMGISPAMADAAKEQGLTLTVRYIPNEVFDKRAIAKGQVKFYEAGYLEAKCKVNNRDVEVTLSDFGVFYRQDDADEAAAALRNGAAKIVVDQGQVVRVAKNKEGVISRENLTSNWQDWIDYWAIDFDFASQPEVVTVVEGGKETKKKTGRFIFENTWQSFRTKSDRSLELTSSLFTYAQPGDYSIAVKVVDIFGNDTTRVFKVKVK